MSTTPPKRIAIVGGGISSIITAFELTATPELRAQHDITLYQMGWRLGGKLASGGNPKIGGRNEEHGLHVWFGFYDNAFFEITRCYEELAKIQPEARYKSYDEAFKPCDYTPVGHCTDDGSYGFWDFYWPVVPGTPGVYNPLPRPLVLLGSVLRWLHQRIHDHFDIAKFVSIEAGKLIAQFHEAFERLLAKVEHTVEPIQVLSDNWVDANFQRAITWIESLDQLSDVAVYADAQLLIAFLTQFKNHLIAAINALGFRHPDDHPIVSGVELAFTTIIGLLKPENGWLKDFNLNRFDDVDLRAWMIANGGNPQVVNESSILRALYDIPFAYVNGDINQPNFAAGSSLRWVFRTVFTYRGHAMYEPQCGFGEAVIAPYYKVLEARGVKFQFFHKLVETTVSDDKTSVQSLRFALQAHAIGGTYNPVSFSGGLYHWPIEPDWNQLVNGEDARKAGADFESHWNPYPPVGEVVINVGTDFDHVVIGLAGGVWKRLNAVDQSPVGSLLDAIPQFNAAASSLGLVATSGVQFWFNKAVTDLGWKLRPASVGGPEPLDVWADMSQVIATEEWTGEVLKSLHYLCGPIATTLYSQPSPDQTVTEQADALVEEMTLEWLENYGVCDWPGGKDANGNFDWSILFDSSNAAGKDRLKAQYLRANVAPTECCGQSLAGTTKHRVSSDDMLLKNLSIVGADTNTGVNVTCVEGATISGRKASRAICGSPQFIPNENYMGGPFNP